MIYSKQLWWGQEWETTVFKSYIIYSILACFLQTWCSKCRFLFSVFFFSFFFGSNCLLKQATPCLCLQKSKITLSQYFNLVLPSSLVLSDCTVNSLLMPLLMLSLQNETGSVFFAYWDFFCSQTGKCEVLLPYSNSKWNQISEII